MDDKQISCLLKLARTHWRLQQSQLLKIFLDRFNTAGMSFTGAHGLREPHHCYQNAFYHYAAVLVSHNICAEVAKSRPCSPSPNMMLKKPLLLAISIDDTFHVHSTSISFKTCIQELTVDNPSHSHFPIHQDEHLHITTLDSEMYVCQELDHDIEH